MKKKKDKNEVLVELSEHYKMWDDEREQRQHRENGWDDIIDAYLGHLPDNWAYYSTVVDPRIRTTILEKSARLTNSKLKGRLIPREGGDVLKARLNNSLLDFQWDNANYGGSMNAKWGMMDKITRLFGSSFALVKWKRETTKIDGEEKVIFDGNEFEPIHFQDIGLDPNCNNIRDAKWCIVREWTTLEELETVNDQPGEPVFPGLKELKVKISSETNERRDNSYIQRVKQIRNLHDEQGKDSSFPSLGILTEYRPDRWITWSRRYNCILRDIENPYKHKKIPIVQLKYYDLPGDPWGESEVESVLSLFRSIQATICGYLDNMNIHMRPPLKILENEARIETLVWGPEAQWLVNRQDAVEEMRGSGEALRYFQTTYSALVAAFNTAMGDTSQGIGGVDPFNPQKTATEIKKSTRQQNVRDQNNQLYLSQAISDTMQMWLSNNQQFLFMEKRYSYLLRIVGLQNFEYFIRAGLDELVMDMNSINLIKDIINQREIAGQPVNNIELQTMIEAGKSPLFPVILNPESKDNLQIVPKMKVNDMKDGADIYLTPEDINGVYDYVPSITTMESGSNDIVARTRKEAIQNLLNPTVIQLLKEQGVTPNFKDLLILDLEEGGFKDAERFFQTNQQQDELTEPNGQSTSVQPNMGQQGLPEPPITLPQAGNGQQMVGPSGIPGQGQVLQGIPPIQSQGGGLPGVNPTVINTRNQY